MYRNRFWSCRVPEGIIPPKFTDFHVDLRVFAFQPCPGIKSSASSHGCTPRRFSVRYNSCTFGLSAEAWHKNTFKGCLVSAISVPFYFTANLPVGAGLHGKRDDFAHNCFVGRNTLSIVETRPYGLDFMGFSSSSVHMDGLDSM